MPSSLSNNRPPGAEGSSMARRRAPVSFARHKTSLSLPGLTGQSSTPGRWLLDRPVKPGDDIQKVGFAFRTEAWLILD
jgi:hypothetical protein